MGVAKALLFSCICVFRALLYFFLAPSLFFFFFFNRNHFMYCTQEEVFLFAFGCTGSLLLCAGSV